VAVSVRTFDNALDPSVRVDQLRHEIEQHNYNYFVRDAPTVPDSEYDGLLNELRILEELHPELQDPTSPTQRVGGQVGAGFRPHRHPRPMLSLANAFSHEQLDAWYQRVRSLAPDARIEFVVEPKIDGLAIALMYARGNFRIGATRGNGIEGEDVTANLRTLAEVPERLRDGNVPDLVEVRGEIYMSIQGFQQLNDRRAEAGESLFANPRNSAAGSLRQLDPEITRSRPLHLFAYQIGYLEGAEISSQQEALERLREWGFVVNPLARHAAELDEVHAFCEALTHERERLDYEIDGVVIKINSVVQQEELGSVGREPRWAIAYKFPPRQATTQLVDIHVNVGRTGTINPYAVLEPVTVGGVIVRQATLHNEEDIHRKDIRVGDRVIVHRAGDVIPQVVKPLVEDRDGTQEPYRLPEACPSCGTPLVRPDGEAMTYCPSATCPAQRFRWLEHFVSEPAMDIRGLGERQVEVLLRHALVRDPADIYRLDESLLLSLPGIKEKSASNLLRAIERSKRRPLANLIFALGIRYVGMQTAELLAGTFHDLGDVLSATVDQLEAIEGIGNKTAESIVAWTSRTENRDIALRLRDAGVAWQERPQRGPAGPLAGKTFLLTGRLDTLSRGQAESRLKEMGARIAPGMSNAVDYLVAGADPGSKLAKAKKLGTPVKSEEWLVYVLEGGELSE
jgi:DNA ligase (NAD+)